MSMAILESIVVVLLLMLLLIIIIIVFACKPWRFLSTSRSSTIKVPELERPLVSDNVDPRDQGNEFPRDYDLEGAFQSDVHFRSPRAHGLMYKQRVPATSPDVVADSSEEISVGETLRRPYDANQISEVHRPSRQRVGNERYQESPGKDILHKRSCISLEVISGPSLGFRTSIHSTSTSRLPLTIGRVSPSDIVLKDSEVSGKHALINWDLKKMKWELLDMGSLNGTLLNSQPIHHPDSGSRHWSDPTELASGDIITLGTSSNVYVHITSQTEDQIPFGFGVASDPMALRRGGKKLVMEDMFYYKWPLPGVSQLGLFGICDGHGGSAAAKDASEILPEMIATILSDSLKRDRLLSLCNASDVLRDAFSQTESCMNHHYEGCTATLLLVWVDCNDNYFTQCANVGDSAWILNVDGKQIRMTEDHRVTSNSERHRIENLGKPLKDGETRLCGLNLARMLGDKFLKQQDIRFSSEPYISQVVHVNQASRAFALMASDGFWDVISVKKAIQLVFQAQERYSTDSENLAEKIANFLLAWNFDGGYLDTSGRKVGSEDGPKILPLSEKFLEQCLLDYRYQKLKYEDSAWIDCDRIISSILLLMPHPTFISKMARPQVQTLKKAYFILPTQRRDESRIT